MQKDDEDKKKLEKGQERITHKIAKDLEKADRKRKAEEEAKEATNRDMVENEDIGEGPNKRSKPAQEEEMDVEMDGAASSGLAGGATGAPGETLKRKREETDSDPGLDIDLIEEKSNAEIKKFVDRKLQN